MARPRVRQLQPLKCKAGELTISYGRPAVSVRRTSYRQRDATWDSVFPSILNEYLRVNSSPRCLVVRCHPRKRSLDIRDVLLNRLRSIVREFTFRSPPTLELFRPLVGNVPRSSCKGNAHEVADRIVR